jgi:hypothetical protein
MAYECRIERHSVSPEGSELLSIVWRFPRRVLAEAKTHRTLPDGASVEVTWDATEDDMSKNSSSSRAIPFERLVKDVLDEPFRPAWTVAQRGMQGDYVTDGDVLTQADAIWHEALGNCAWYAQRLHRLGLHKQDCNRILEPFAWVTQIVTATRRSWNNYWSLRCHHAADPNIRTLARLSYLKALQSRPVPLTYGQWHLPFVPLDEQMAFRFEANAPTPLPPLIHKSIARCAWVSYDRPDRAAAEEDYERVVAKLLSERPVHASPAEAQATPLSRATAFAMPQLKSNLDGWLQARKLIAFERNDSFEPTEEELNEYRADLKARGVSLD